MTPSGMSLFTVAGRRKYLTASERLRFMMAAAAEPSEIETLCLALAWTGCRISETLALTYADIDHDERTVSVHCLKKRKQGVSRPRRLRPGH